jgi:cell division protein FtsW
MTDQRTVPEFVEVDEPQESVSLTGKAFQERLRVARPAQVAPVESMPRVEPRAAGRSKSLIGSLDAYLMIVVGVLLAIGVMMVYSTTFDWSYQEFGDESVRLFQHLRNLGIGALMMTLLALIDYRVWRKLAVLILLLTIASLIAVLLFGDERFGARRALIDGSYQPGELAELVIVIYIAAWLGSKGAKVRSIWLGLIPFMVLVGIIGVLVLLQPDLSTAAVIFVTAGVLYFLAGADITHLVVVLGIAGSAGWIISQRLSYAQDRVSDYLAGLNDLTQTSYHVQQAVIAFLNGGWFGVGLGEGRQKFGNLPAPHTDSIFAVIGEELGIVGAALVVALYVAFVIRGFQISRRAVDPFGALLAAGIPIWVSIKALLNIAVMTSLLPSTGVPLPFISFGGSSLVVLMAGVGLLLSIARVTARQPAPERRSIGATLDRSGRNRRSRLSSAGNSRSDAQTSPGS